MLFCLLFGRRLRSGINDSEIKMRIRVARIVRNRLGHFFLGRFLPAFLARGDAEIIVRRRTLGIDRKRLGQLGQRIVEFALPIINDAQRRMRKLTFGATAIALRRSFRRLQLPARKRPARFDKE
jgi:hypothetical protein